MLSGFNIIADALLPVPPAQRPESRCSVSMDRSGSVLRNKKRNSIIVDSVLKRTSTIMSGREAEPALPARGIFGLGRGAQQVRRWEGNKRTWSDWDSLRRDPELWYPGGDALIHLYAKGNSRRGPSFRLPYADIEQSKCAPLLDRALAGEPGSPAARDSCSDDGGFASNPNPEGKWELYIPAPGVLDRDQAFKFHITTRNFFAWMFDKPLVGVKLGEELIALHERMDAFRTDREQNQDDMLAYIDNQGYTDFRDCPDHALGVLQYAERFELTELWTDAFVHCSGMNDNLVGSRDFAAVSRTTKALITRANLEMSVRLDRASMSLSNFMEDDLAFLRLEEPVTKHIERFRSFLHSYYVQKNGYWPPFDTKTEERGRQGRPGPLPKNTLLSMYADFRNLYELLADVDAPSGGVSSDHAANDGFNVAQTVAHFDRRQKFSSLPYVLPRLPSNLPEVSESRLSSFLPSFLRRTRAEQRTGTLAALHHATNVSSDPSVMGSPLVIEYFRFERQYTLNEEERLSPADARKARWMLVYAILQTLADITKAPAEVRDTEGVDYPLCCQTAGTPPWAATSVPRPSLASATVTQAPSIKRRNSSLSSVTERSAHSPAPSARVDPLDLELVASKRLSYSQAPADKSRSSSITRSPMHLSALSPVRPPSLARRLASTDGHAEVHSPKPRRPASKEQALIATYDSTIAAEPAEFGSDEEVPALSPSLGRSGSDGGRRSSEEGSSASEADTPTSSRFGASIFTDGANKGVPAPPSPSIYDGDVDNPNKSEFNLLAAGQRKLDSDELARRWQGEIGAM